jgi:hypothetical protein
MSIVSSTCHRVFSYEVVNVIIFQCIVFFFLHFLLLCRSETTATNGSQQCSALVNVMKNVGGPNCRIIAILFFLLLQIVRRGVDVLEIYLSNIRFYNFF